MCTLIETRILNALENNKCSYANMCKYFTKETNKEYISILNTSPLE